MLAKADCLTNALAPFQCFDTLLQLPKTANALSNGSKYAAQITSQQHQLRIHVCMRRATPQHRKVIAHPFSQSSRGALLGSCRASANM
jgi:hypothetical protein